MNGLTISKVQLRKDISLLKKQHSVENLNTQSEAVVKHLLNNSFLVNAKRVVMYYPLADEVDVRKAITRLCDYGIDVFLPQVVSDNEMVFRRYDGLDSMHKGAFGIMEPTGFLLDDIDTINVIVVPGVAFDSFGNRLGRGKGYYDRMLIKMTNSYKIGVCFNFQKLEKIPVEPNDVKMDIVISSQ